METDQYNRAFQLRRARQLEAITVCWNVAGGIAAVLAGVVAGWTALVGFGIDSFIETASAAVVAWRLGEETHGYSEERIERVEKLASCAAGALLLTLALYIVVDATRRLLGAAAQPHASVMGVAVTVAALVVMPLLGRAKLRTASALNSGVCGPTLSRVLRVPGLRPRP